MVELRHALALGLIEEGKKVLDLGSEDGIFVDLLIKERGCNVTASDVDQSCVKKLLARKINAVVCDVERELPKGDFDYITCLDVIEHLKRPEIFLENLKKTYPNSLIVISTPNACWWKDRLSILFGKIPRRNAYSKSAGKYAHKMTLHYWLWSYSQFKEFLMQNGLKILEERYKYVPHIPFPKNWFIYSYALKVGGDESRK